MADCGLLQSKKKFSCSPRLLSNFVSQGCNDSESICMNSPTSILDAKPFWSAGPKTPKVENRTSSSIWEKLEPRGFGLALVYGEPISDLIVNPKNRVLVPGSKLRIQVPPLPAIPNESPVDFGTKTRDSHVGSVSPSPVKKSLFSSTCFTSKMELSEDYTCVISYGANPRTTHIFDDCVVESCCGVVNLSESSKENELLFDQASSIYPSDEFNSFCYNCNKSLGQGIDIYMYRGEKAFCSSKCRYKEMMLEAELETSKYHHVYGTQ